MASGAGALCRIGEHPLAVAYVGGAAVGTALLLLVPLPGSAPPVLWLAWTLYFGPMGVLLDVAVAPSGLFATGFGGSRAVLPATAVFVVLAGVGVLNAWAALRLQRAWRAPAAQPSAVGVRDGVAGLLFVLAGAGFVFLCIVDGFAGLTAGIDPDASAAAVGTHELAATATWVAGAAIAIAGLIVWTAWRRRTRPSLLRWAIVEVVAMCVLLVAAIVNASIGA